MDIGWIFAMFPSINNLEIWWSGARLIGYERSQPIICPNLTKLYFGKVVTHPNLLKFICDCAPNLKDLHWKILAKKEKNDQINDSEIQLEEPNMKKGVAYYHIDLTGFSLDCFHLDIDLKENPTDKYENVYLSLKRKHRTTKEFITLKKHSHILPKGHNLFPKSIFP
jgi:hypothetical protein